jgi:hypothetical protein
MALQQDSIETLDTLHLPLPTKGHSLLDVQLPQYYRESFFTKDTLFHPELPGGRSGVAGDPIPYNIHNDSVITSILLGFFILMVIAYANTHEFVVRQLKKFFYVPNEGVQDMAETGTELRVQLFMVLLNCVLLSLLYYFYVIHFVSDSFILKSQYLLIAIYMVMMVCYFIAKWLIYKIVNTIFFGSKINRHWLKTYLFISSMEGVVFLPAVLLQTYFDMTEKNVVIYFIIVLIFVKLLTFFKCYVAFFRRNVVKLQIILYFCALEMVPLVAFWGALDYVTDSLKINF